MSSDTRWLGSLVLLCLVLGSPALGESRAADAALAEPEELLVPSGPHEGPAPAAAPLAAVAKPLKDESPPFARGDTWHGFSFRVGGLFMAPTGRSQAVELVNVSPMAQLSGLKDGPIAGSWTSMGSKLMAAATVGWAPPILNRQLSIETILALPFSQKMYAGGTLADVSLAPSALAVLPTGVPPLGSEIGEVNVLPPVLTLVYRFFPAWRFRPYVGLGASVLFVMGVKVTNPVLAEISPPKVHIPPKVGWVVQAGAEVRLVGPLFLTGDFKYIGGLDLTARLSDIYVRLPGLPLYGATRVGDNVVRVSVNPVVVQLGVGMNI